MSYLWERVVVRETTLSLAQLGSKASSPVGRFIYFLGDFIRQTSYWTTNPVTFEETERQILLSVRLLLRDVSIVINGLKTEGG